MQNQQHALLYAMQNKHGLGNAGLFQDHDYGNIEWLFSNYFDDDGEFSHFMDPNSYEQVAGNDVSVGDAKQWLKEQDTCTVQSFTDQCYEILSITNIARKRFMARHT